MERPIPGVSFHPLRWNIVTSLNVQPVSRSFIIYVEVYIFKFKSDFPSFHTHVARGAIIDSGQCKVNHYKCKSGECIPNAWVCDGASVSQINRIETPTTEDPFYAFRTVTTEVQMKIIVYNT